MKWVLFAVLFAGCYISHRSSPDAGLDAACDPYNPAHPTLCHWRQIEVQPCEFTKKGC